MSLVQTYIKAKEREARQTRRPQAGEWKYSELLGDRFTMDGKDIVFSDGTRYTERELELLRHETAEAKRNIHRAKQVFGGTIR